MSGSWTGHASYHLDLSSGGLWPRVKENVIFFSVYSITYNIIHIDAYSKYNTAQAYDAHTASVHVTGPAASHQAHCTVTIQSLKTRKMKSASGRDVTDLRCRLSGTS